MSLSNEPTAVDTASYPISQTQTSRLPSNTVPYLPAAMPSTGPNLSTHPPHAQHITSRFPLPRLSLLAHTPNPPETQHTHHAPPRRARDGKGSPSDSDSGSEESASQSPASLPRGLSGCQDSKSKKHETRESYPEPTAKVEEEGDGDAGFGFLSGIDQRAQMAAWERLKKGNTAKRASRGAGSGRGRGGGGRGIGGHGAIVGQGPRRKSKSAKQRTAAARLVRTRNFAAKRISGAVDGEDQIPESEPPHPLPPSPKPLPRRALIAPAIATPTRERGEEMRPRMPLPRRALIALAFATPTRERGEERRPRMPLPRRAVVLGDMVMGDADEDEDADMGLGEAKDPQTHPPTRGVPRDERTRNPLPRPTRPGAGASNASNAEAGMQQQETRTQIVDAGEGDDQDPVEGASSALGMPHSLGDAPAPVTLPQAPKQERAQHHNRTTDGREAQLRSLSSLANQLAVEGTAGARDCALEPEGGVDVLRVLGVGGGMDIDGEGGGGGEEGYREFEECKEFEQFEGVGEEGFDQFGDFDIDLDALDFAYPHDETSAPSPVLPLHPAVTTVDADVDPISQGNERANIGCNADILMAFEHAGEEMGGGEEVEGEEGEEDMLMGLAYPDSSSPSPSADNGWIKRKRAAGPPSAAGYEWGIMRMVWRVVWRYRAGSQRWRTSHRYASEIPRGVQNSYQDSVWALPEVAAPATATHRLSSDFFAFHACLISRRPCSGISTRGRVDDYLFTIYVGPNRRGGRLTSLSHHYSHTGTSTRANTDTDADTDPRPPASPPTLSYAPRLPITAKRLPAVCAGPRCMNLLAVELGYGWKMCEPCRAQARRYQRVRKFGGDAGERSVGERTASEDAGGQEVGGEMDGQGIRGDGEKKSVRFADENETVEKLLELLDELWVEWWMWTKGGQWVGLGTGAGVDVEDQAESTPTLDPSEGETRGLGPGGKRSNGEMHASQCYAAQAMDVDPPEPPPPPRACEVMGMVGEVRHLGEPLLQIPAPFDGPPPLSLDTSVNSSLSSPIASGRLLAPTEPEPSPDTMLTGTPSPAIECPNLPHTYTLASAFTFDGTFSVVAPFCNANVKHGLKIACVCPRIWRVKEMAETVIGVKFGSGTAGGDGEESAGNQG
ncbi:hypothetical protein EYR38_002003 [Pleurotus pulmonarius]|nr:hypothetical protein EYR38_002003 [Pleurotus pulmonarius]